MESAFSILITPEIAYLAASVITIMLFIGKFPYKETFVNKTKVWKKYGIFMLLVFCIAGSFFPGVAPEGSTVGQTLMFGLVSAACAKIGRNLLKPIFFSKLEGKE